MKRLILLTLSSVLILAVCFATYYVSAGDNQKNNVVTAHIQQNNEPNSATVSFGAWLTTPVVDRQPNLSPNMTGNLHQMVPRVATIRAGGTVNFIIAGFHQIAVYDNGTQPGSINTSMRILPVNGGPPLISDPNNRIYRGLDPSTQSTDRVEAVHFSRPGIYLVICTVLPHFVDGQMYGFVEVTPGSNTSNNNDHGKGKH